MNTNKYKNMMFFAPDEGGGEGGGESVAGTGELSRGATAFEPTVKQTTGDRPLPEKKPAEKPASSGPSGAETPPAAPSEAPPTGGFDASKFAKEFGATLSEQLKPVLEQKVEKKELSPEEARKLLKVWEPDENWFKSFDNLETRSDAIVQMRDALVQQADVLAQARLEQAIAGLREEITPGLTAVRQAEERAREERLHKQYPTLANPVLKPLLDAIATDFITNKKTFKNESELFQALANGVESVMKVNNPEFKLEAASNGDQTQADRGGRNLPVTTPGGSGNTGRRDGGDKQAKPRGIAVFDKS
jgi:hypothetical protein